MKKAEAVIFDMDGTLYNFPDELSFSQSPFGAQVRQNVQQFIGREFKLDDIQSVERYDVLSKRYDGEMSMGLEREFGIDRMRFFAETWNIEPSKFIDPVPGVRQAIESIDAKPILLSAAPRVWTDRALGFMALADVFEDRIFTGEPDIRKPNPAIFTKILDTYGLNADRVVSIGDQEYSDIAPAKRLGMIAVKIGITETMADFAARDVVGAINILQGRSIL